MDRITGRSDARAKKYRHSMDSNTSLHFLALVIIAQKMNGVGSVLPGLQRCHYDPDPPPADQVLPPDTFTWMAVLELLHRKPFQSRGQPQERVNTVKHGVHHNGMMPRVSIIHPSFGLTTAAAASNVPPGYSLGNVVIVEYVRDEQSCGLSLNEAMRGEECPRSSYVIPIDDVIFHPEYASFGAPDGLALLKLIRPLESGYMMPVCLPCGGAWTYDKKVEKTYLLDFLSVAPEDYEKERKGIKRLHIIPKVDCTTFQEFLNISKEWQGRVLCTTGCGMRPGSPLVAHDNRLRAGFYWHLVGVAVGGPHCKESAARHRRNNDPPRFVYVWPYVDWMEQVLMSHERPFPLPVNVFRTKELDYRRGYNPNYTAPYRKKWEGRWYTEGNWCNIDIKMGVQYAGRYNRFVFYEDYIEVRTVKKSNLRYSLNLRTETDFEIRCIKVQMPNQFLTPKIFLDPKRPYNSTVTIPLVTFPGRFYFRVQGWANRANDTNAKKWRDELKNPSK